MKLFFRKYGEGPPLIILHGLYGSSDNWVSVAKILGTDFTVYLPDIRNHGQSPHEDAMDYDCMRDDLLELADDLSLKKFFLAGHSMGGKAAFAFALKWPARLNGLLIADISPFTLETGDHFDFHSDIINALKSVDLSIYKSRKEVEDALITKMPSERIRGFILKNLQRSEDGSFSWKLNVEAIANNLDKLSAGVEPAHNNKEISRFPVIFLRGSESDYLSDEDFRKAQKIFPASELIEIEGAGHWLHTDRPDEVIMCIRKFL